MKMRIAPFADSLLWVFPNFYTHRVSTSLCTLFVKKKIPALSKLYTQTLLYISLFVVNRWLCLQLLAFLRFLNVGLDQEMIQSLLIGIFPLNSYNVVRFWLTTNSNFMICVPNNLHSVVISLAFIKKVYDFAQSNPVISIWALCT